MRIYHEGFVPAGIQDLVFVAEEGPMKGKLFDINELNKLNPDRTDHSDYMIGFPMPLLAVHWHPGDEKLIDPGWQGYLKQVVDEGPLRGGYGSRTDALAHGYTEGTLPISDPVA